MEKVEAPQDDPGSAQELHSKESCNAVSIEDAISGSDKLTKRRQRRGSVKVDASSAPRITIKLATKRRVKVAASHKSETKENQCAKGSSAQVKLKRGAKTPESGSAEVKEEVITRRRGRSASLPQSVPDAKVDEQKVVEKVRKSTRKTRSTSCGDAVEPNAGEKKAEPTDSVSKESTEVKKLVIRRRHRLDSSRTEQSGDHKDEATLSESILEVSTVEEPKPPSKKKKKKRKKRNRKDKVSEKGEEKRDALSQQPAGDSVENNFVGIPGLKLTRIRNPKARSRKKCSKFIWTLTLVKCKSKTVSPPTQENLSKAPESLSKETECHSKCAKELDVSEEPPSRSSDTAEVNTLQEPESKDLLNTVGVTKSPENSDVTEKERESSRKADVTSGKGEEETSIKDNEEERLREHNDVTSGKNEETTSRNYDGQVTLRKDEEEPQVTVTSEVVKETHPEVATETDLEPTGTDFVPPLQIKVVSSPGKRNSLKQSFSIQQATTTPKPKEVSQEPDHQSPAKMKNQTETTPPTLVSKARHRLNLNSPRKKRVRHKAWTSCKRKSRRAPSGDYSNSKTIAETEVPVAEAEVPVAATEAAAPETEPLAAATEPPAAETESPAAATEAPAAETEPPAAATEAPAAGTEAPGVVTEASATEMEPPAATTEVPAAATEPKLGELPEPHERRKPRKFSSQAALLKSKGFFPRYEAPVSEAAEPTSVNCAALPLQPATEMQPEIKTKETPSPDSAEVLILEPRLVVPDQAEAPYHAQQPIKQGKKRRRALIGQRLKARRKRLPQRQLTEEGADVCSAVVASEPARSKLVGILKTKYRKSPVSLSLPCSLEDKKRRAKLFVQQVERELGPQKEKPSIDEKTDLESEVQPGKTKFVKNIKHFIMPVVSARSSRVIKTPKRFMDDADMSDLPRRNAQKKGHQLGLNPKSKKRDGSDEKDEPSFLPSQDEEDLLLELPEAQLDLDLSSAEESKLEPVNDLENLGEEKFSGKRRSLLRDPGFNWQVLEPAGAEIYNFDQDIEKEYEALLSAEDFSFDSLLESPQKKKPSMKFKKPPSHLKLYKKLKDELNFGPTKKKLKKFPPVETGKTVLPPPEAQKVDLENETSLIQSLSDIKAEKAKLKIEDLDTPGVVRKVSICVRALSNKSLAQQQEEQVDDMTDEFSIHTDISLPKKSMGKASACLILLTPTQKKKSQWHLVTSD